MVFLTASARDSVWEFLVQSQLTCGQTSASYWMSGAAEVCFDAMISWQMLGCESDKPYGVAVAEVQGWDDLSEELSGLFRC